MRLRTWIIFGAGYVWGAWAGRDRLLELADRARDLVGSDLVQDYLQRAQASAVAGGANGPDEEPEDLDEEEEPEDLEDEDVDVDEDEPEDLEEEPEDEEPEEDEEPAEESNRKPQRARSRSQVRRRAPGRTRR